MPELDFSTVGTIAASVIGGGGLTAVVTAVLSHRRESTKQVFDKDEILFSHFKDRLEKVEGKVDECEQKHADCQQQHIECIEKNSLLEGKICTLESSVRQLQQQA